MFKNVRTHLGGAVGVAVAVAANPGGEGNGGDVNGQFLAKGDTALRVELAEVAGHCVP